MIEKIVLFVVFCCMSFAALLRRVFGRDPLHLHRPPVSASFWIVRDPRPDTQSYFTEESVAEGVRARYDASSVWIGRDRQRPSARFLRRVAQLFGARRDVRRRQVPLSSGPEQDIPDEIYTLW